MNHRKFALLLGLGAWIFPAALWADEGEASAEAESSAGEKAAKDDTATVAAAPGSAFAAPNGLYGAGLSLDPAQKARAWGELTFHTQSAVTLISPVLGGGYKVIDPVEIELILPIAFASYDAFDLAAGQTTSEGKLVVGDVYLGANYLMSTDKLRLKLGGGFALPFAPNGGFIPLYAAIGAAGAQDRQLWLSSTLSILTPSRVEYVMGKLILSGDASLGIHIPTGDNAGDTDISLSLAPGIGTFLGADNLVGGRLPLFWLITTDGDNAQVALEPYFRHDFKKAFIDASFTLNLDNPFGFSFDSGGFWGLRAGGGMVF